MQEPLGVCLGSHNLINMGLLEDRMDGSICLQMYQVRSTVHLTTAHAGTPVSTKSNPFQNLRPLTYLTI
jgi:hypothetical protein